MEDAIGYVAVEVGEAEDSEEINVPWIKESIEQGIQRLPIDGNQSHHGSPTIHRVRYHMRAGNKRAFTPQLVSIGPYHYGSKTLKKMEALKLKYLHDLMKRSSIENPLFRCIESVRRKAAKAKKQYSRTVQLKPEEFVKMMVVDGCFVIEFLIKYVMDPDQMNILKTEMPSLVNDLLMVENQIPFFIVRDIFELLNISVSLLSLHHNFQEFKLLLKYVRKSEIREYSTIEELALCCFTRNKSVAVLAADMLKDKKKSFCHLLHLYHSSFNQDLDEFLEDNNQPTWIHKLIAKKLLHQNCGSLSIKYFLISHHVAWFIFRILRASSGLLKEILRFLSSKLWDCFATIFMIPILIVEICIIGRFEKDGGETQWRSRIPNARYLHNSGFNFKKKKGDFQLDVSFSGTTIAIPGLSVDDTTSIRFKNLVAFEQFSPEEYGYHVTAFAKFMDYLIDTKEDVAILRECGIIDNQLGEDAEMASFFNNLLKGIHIDDKKVFKFDHVQDYYTMNYHKVKFFQWRKKLGGAYFSNAWVMPSMFIMFSLVVLQTFYTIYPYYNPRS